METLGVARWETGALRAVPYACVLLIQQLIYVALPRLSSVDLALVLSSVLYVVGVIAVGIAVGAFAQTFAQINFTMSVATLFVAGLGGGFAKSEDLAAPLQWMSALAPNHGVVATVRGGDPQLLPLLILPLAVVLSTIGMRRLAWRV
jgi:hypothetical protein